MIWMSIGSAFIKCNHYLGAKLANDGDEFAENFCGTDVNEGAWIIVFGSTVHAGVAIIQEPQVVDAEDISSFAHFTLPYLSQIFGCCQRWIGDLAGFPTCGTDQAGLDTLCVILQDSTAHCAFIIGMSKNT